jgi:plasmid stabilization system protein ParE
VPAKHRVRITRLAEIDIDVIWSFIAEDSANEAGEFILELEKQIDTLEHFPETSADPRKRTVRNEIPSFTLQQLPHDLSDTRRFSLCLAGPSRVKAAGYFFLRIVAIRALALLVY